MSEQSEPENHTTVSKSAVDPLVMCKFHTRCGDCGQFLPKTLWVPKDHRWKRCALCSECLSKYDSPEYH